MRASLNGIDAVGIRKNRFIIGVVILKGDLDIDIVFFFFKIKDLVVLRRFIFRKMFNERDDASFK